MKNLIQDIHLIRQFNSPCSGVFLLADLVNLLAEPHKTAVYRRIEHLEKAGVLRRFMKGIYITSDADIEILNQKICSRSYISFGRVLAEYKVIAAHPAHALDAVKPGKSRMHHHPSFAIRQFGIAEHLIFGYETVKGVHKAAPEKALLDTLYFHQHGADFPFDIHCDINWKRVDKDIVGIYLQEYRNPKFTAFVQGMMSQAKSA